VLRTVTRLKAESSLPIRLTQRGPLATLTQPRPTPLRQTRDLDYSEFESWGIPEGHFPPIIISTGRSYSRCCYPERNFEHNQLLGSSMSLSPLYVALTNDLHVSIAAGFHQPFDWLHSRHVKITTFRVYIRLLCAPGTVNRSWLTRLVIQRSLYSRASTPLFAI